MLLGFNVTGEWASGIRRTGRHAAAPMLLVEETRRHANGSACLRWRLVSLHHNASEWFYVNNLSINASFPGEESHEFEILYIEVCDSLVLLGVDTDDKVFVFNVSTQSTLLDTRVL